MIHVLPITSWDTTCGIAEYAKHLREALANHPEVFIQTPDPRDLDPIHFFSTTRKFPQVVWLNYHAGLHSRWTASEVRALQAQGIRVVVTFHDTVATGQMARCHELAAVADYFIIHEPAEDLPQALVLRQGIPDTPGVHRTWLRNSARPILGTVGFNFPWKNYDRLAQITADAGWQLLIISPNAQASDVMRWEALNPRIEVVTGFEPSSMVVGRLLDCDATAFLYECANTGTSGAIRQGIAALKPVYAMRRCRQFRDLYRAERAEECVSLIRWVDSLDEFRIRLKTDPIVATDPGMVYLSVRDSWRRQASVYAEVFQAVSAGAPAEVPGGPARADPT